MSLCQRTGFVKSLQRLAGLDWEVPEFSTLCRRQKTLSVAIPYRGGIDPLHRLIDATAVKVEGEGEWNVRKHGGSKMRLWRKLNLGMDKETLEIHAVGVTRSNFGDAPMLPDLLEQISHDQEIGTVIADGAYHTRGCHNVIAALGAVPASCRSRRLNSENQPPRGPSCCWSRCRLLSRRYYPLRASVCAKDIANWVPRHCGAQRQKCSRRHAGFPQRSAAARAQTSANADRQVMLSISGTSTCLRLS